MGASESLSRGAAHGAVHGLLAPLERDARLFACDGLAPKHAQQPFARNFDRLETINFQLASDGTFHGLPGHGYFGFQLFGEYEIVFKMAEWLIVVRLLNVLGHG
jgi:hypothetical protein